MRLALVPFLMLILGTTPANARSWWSRACGRLLRERPSAPPVELRSAYENLEDEISRINRFSNRHLTAGLERLDEGEWALVVRPRSGDKPWAFASKPADWFALVKEEELASFREEAVAIMERNPGMQFVVRSRAKDGLLLAWIEGDLSEAQRTRTMLVMLQYALETANGKKLPKN